MTDEQRREAAKLEQRAAELAREAEKLNAKAEKLRAVDEPSIDDRIAEAQAEGDFAKASRLKEEKLKAHLNQQPGDDTDDDVDEDQLRADIDEAEERGDFSRSARLKERLLRQYRRRNGV